MLNALLIAAATAAFYLVDPGPFRVVAHDPVILDGRETGEVGDLRLRVSLPEDATATPVIVWSHGYGGSRQAYQPLVRHWASHGYAVIQVDHRDSYLMPGYTPPDDPCAPAFDFADWDVRPAEIRYLLNRLKVVEAAVGGDFDFRRVALGGHSFGATTMQLVGGAIPRDGRDFGHPLPLALLLISATGNNVGLFDETSHLTMTRPALVMTGTQDGSDPYFPWYRRTDPYFQAGSDEKYLPVIIGGDHAFGGIYGDLPVEVCEDLVEDTHHLNITLSASMMFLDTYLRESPEARTYARSRALPRASGGELIYLFE